MRILGILLIIAGILLVVFRGFNVQTEKKVLDAGPIEINKKENRWVGWPTYTGAIAIVAGMVLMVTGSRKKTD